MVRSEVAGASIWARLAESVAEALAVVAGFLDMQHDGRAMRRLEADVRALVASSLPILVHKRINLRGDPAAWHTERDFYVDRILWPSLFVAAEDRARIRARVVALVERQVAAGQATAVSANDHAMPSVWQGDTGWAS